MSLIGSRLGHHDVTALIGEGGMGQVYQATDTKLNRQVALKILPEAFAADPDRLARFQREAQVLASLNHPNIAQIHGLEETDDTRALVLELVEGPTLADRIKQGPIPVDEALPIAKQIAEALEAAHEAGVIHRDLKPANIKVREDGTVKVLDFGLARALRPDVMSGDASQSPTLTAAATQAGVILGTAAYMAPEQARGKTVDKAADIWGFGTVLFEMLAGRRAFPGDNLTDTIAAVVKSEPAWETLPDDVSPRLAQVLRACLQKNAKQRVRDIGDVRLAMEGAFETAVDTTVHPATSQKTGSRFAWAMAGAVAAALLTGGVMWSQRPAPPPPVVEHVSVTLPPDVSVPFFGDAIALSPNGRHLVYAGESDGVRRLYHRAMDQREAVPLPGTEGAFTPTFSPDGQWIAFWAESAGLRRVALAGGPPVTIRENPATTWMTTRWGPDDRIWFGNTTSGLRVVPAFGGTPELVTSPGEAENGHFWAAPMPNGRDVLFTVNPSNDDPPHIAVYDHETGEQRMLADGTLPSYAPTGHVVYLSGDRELTALPFDAVTLQATGPPAAILPSGVARFYLSDDGSLTYLPGVLGGNDKLLVWVDRGGVEELIEAEAAPYVSPRLSPDGQRLAVGIERDNRDIYIIDLTNPTTRTRLTFDPAEDRNPLWTPSGDRIVFASDRNGVQSVFSKPADGTDQAKLLVSLPDRVVNPVGWAGGGERLVVGSPKPDGVGQDVGLVSMSGEPTVQWVLVEPYPTFDGTTSPDGSHLAFLSLETGQIEVHVRPFPGVENGRWQIEGWGEDPLWSRDGRELFYRTRRPGGMMMAVPVTTEPSFAFGVREPLFADDNYWGFNGRYHDVSPDGRFLMIKSSGTFDTAARQINIIRNWTEELKRLVPTE